jgi:hypothetical protein
MGDRYWLRVAFLAALMLDAVALAALGGVWYTRPWWEGVAAPTSAAAADWSPLRLEGSGLWTWRPVQWGLRYSGQGRGGVWQLEAGPGARLVIVAEPVAAGERAPKQPAVADVLGPMAKRPGFDAGAATAVDSPLGPGIYAPFRYWQLGGLRLLAWQGWAYRATRGGLQWTACATYPAEDTAFGAAAWQVLAALRPESPSARPIQAPGEPEDE